MIPDIPICPLIFVIVNAFSYCELVGRGCEKAHEGKPTSCGLLNGVHSVRHYASPLLFLTSFLIVWVLILKNARVSIWTYKMERQALLSWSIVSPCRMNVNSFLNFFGSFFSTWFRHGSGMSGMVCQYGTSFFTDPDDDSSVRIYDRADPAY